MGYCSMAVNNPDAPCAGISLAWRFIFSRASRFICNFISFMVKPGGSEFLLVSLPYRQNRRAACNVFARAIWLPLRAFPLARKVRP